MMAKNMEKLLEYFFYNHMHSLGVRELSRKTRLSTATVLVFLRKLTRLNIVKRVKKKGHYAFYKANIRSYLYKNKKISYMLEKIIKSGLIDYLEQFTGTKVIIIFGSIAKSTYKADSDIDIFLQSKKTKLDLGKFEKKLGHDINIFFESNIDTLSPDLLNNIAAGISLAKPLKVSDYGKTEEFKRLFKERYSLRSSSF